MLASTMMLLVVTALGTPVYSILFASANWSFGKAVRYSEVTVLTIVSTSSFAQLSCSPVSKGHQDCGWRCSPPGV